MQIKREDLTKKEYSNIFFTLISAKGWNWNTIIKAMN